jgi:hypothetical protein
MEAILEIRGLDFDLEYEYTPEEPPVMFTVEGHGNPGEPETLEILEIHLEGTTISFTDFFIELNEMDEIKDLLWKHINE